METPTVDKQWMSYAEAQEYAGLGRTLIYELVRAGEIEVSRIGTGSKRKTVRISRQSLDDYMRRHVA